MKNPFFLPIWLSGVVVAMSGLGYAAPTVTTASDSASQVSASLDIATYQGITTDTTYKPLSTQEAPIRVAPISDGMRQEFGIPSFYSKGLKVRGIPISSSTKASDYALLECAYTLDHMFGGSPAWVTSALTKAKTRMSLMSSLEYTMDLPENLGWQTDRSLKTMAFWDERARGMGGLPDASCAEENLLNLSSDHYKSENITIHEFAHTLASAIKESTPQWYERLEATYKKAMAEGRFLNTYSASNEQEYWAEGAQMWFDCAVEKWDPTVHNGIWNRQQLKTYDPELAKLLSEVFGEGTWRYIRTDGKPLRVDNRTYTRPLAEMSHLAGLDRSQIPAFDLSRSPRIQAFKASGEAEKK